MTRLDAASADVICVRHGCAEVAHDSAALPDLPPCATLALAPGVRVPIGPSLLANFAAIRRGYEIEEVYVRTAEEAFEPLRNDHLSLETEFAIIARRRHPSGPRVVGVMLAKDEADVLPAVLASLQPSLHRLYLRAGDADTRAAAESFAPWLRLVDTDAAGDGARQVLLERARADALKDEDRRPMWVLVVQGDEIYADDLLHHIRLADRERATVMTCQVATFLLHESQRDGWDWTKPIEERLTHYIWDFGEHAGFVDFPWVHYRPGEHMRAHPHGIFPAIWASARPVRKHYPFRAPEQARARVEDRLRSGWQPHYRNYEKIFMGAEAAGRPIKKYWGWFPEAERTEGIW